METIQGFGSIRAHLNGSTVIVERIETATGEVKRRSEKAFDAEFLDSLNAEIDARYNDGNSVAHNANAAEDFLERLGFLDEESAHGIDARGRVKVGGAFEEPDHEKDPQVIAMIGNAAHAFAEEVLDLEIGEDEDDLTIHLTVDFDDDDMMTINSITASLYGNGEEHGLDMGPRELSELSRDELVELAKEHIGIAIENFADARRHEEIEGYLHTA